MTPDEAREAVKRKIEEMRRFKEEDLPDIVGTEAVNHFTESFDKEGFTDTGLKKWPNVKRRDPASEWYGFSTTNKKGFSQARANDKVLTGETGELKNSIHYVVKPGRVTVRTDKKYAAVHNFGGAAKVFGKTPSVIKQRQFIGKSAVLEKKIRTKIEKALKQIINSK